MKMGWNAFKFAGLALVATAISVPTLALGEMGARGFYGGLGVHYSIAPHEDRADVHRSDYFIKDAALGSKMGSPSLSTVNGRLGVNFVEGYRFNRYLAAELAGILYGQSRDNLALNGILSPWIARDGRDRMSLMGSLGFSDGDFLPGYGFGFEHFISRFASFSATVNMQPTLTYHRVDHDCHNDNGTRLCSESLSDKRDRLTVWNFGVGYKYYFDGARQSHSFNEKSDVVHVMGLGSGQATLTYPTNYDENSLKLNKWRFDSVDFNISHGIQFNPYYSLELSGHYMTHRGDELRKRHLALWSFAHQVSSPNLADGLFNVYVKAGSFYVNHRRGGLDYGVGIRVMDGAKSLTFGWERFDFRDSTLEPAPQYYYDLLGLKVYYQFGKPSFATRATLPVSSLQKPKRSVGFYLSFLTGSESGQLDETSPLVHQKLALTGYQGLVGLGYQHRLGSEVDLGFELSVGSSSAVYHAEKFSSDVNDFTLAGHSNKELAYYATILPSWSVEGDGSLFARMGLVRASWDQDLHYGVVSSSEGTRNSVSPVAGHEPMRAAGVVLGIGHSIPLTSQLSLALEYDHAWYRYHDIEAKVESSRVSDVRRVNYDDTIFRYKPKDDRFMAGVRYALSSRATLSPRSSYFSKGLFVVLSTERDFHYLKRNTSSERRIDSDLDTDFYVSHGYLDGEGLRATLGYQWMVTPKLNVGFEAYERVLNSAMYVRHHYSDEYWNYHANDSLGLRATLGYVVTPVARCYVHTGVVSTQFERYSSQHGHSMNQYEDNFKEDALGFSMGLGSELAFSKHLAMRLEYGYAAYNGFGMGDPREKSSTRWNYYRFTDDNYSIGLRYQFG